MTLVLYHSWKSSASRRVRLFLEEKKLIYISKEIDLSLQEQHKPEYLKINPNGVVPALLHNDRIIYESSVICEYLDDVFPDHSLRPTDPFLLAQMRNWIRYVDGKINNLICFNWHHRIGKRAAAMSDEELALMISKIPDPSRREAWRRAAREPYTNEELDEARNSLIQIVEKMELMILDQWLIGNKYSLADIAVIPFIMRISEEIAPESLTLSRHPKVHDWWNAVQMRQSFKKARIEPFLL